MTPAPKSSRDGSASAPWVSGSPHESRFKLGLIY